MRVILIDPFLQKIFQHDFSGSAADFFPILPCDDYYTIPLSDEDYMVLDTDGRKKNLPYFELIGAAIPFCGRALVVGTTSVGATLASTFIHLPALAASITFRPTLRFAGIVNEEIHPEGLPASSIARPEFYDLRSLH